MLTIVLSRSDHLAQHANINAVTAYSPAQALKLSLDAMSQRLAQICETANQMDVASIASAADAISKVAQALSQVRQLGEH